MDGNNEIVNVFWTGGWDSTFIILQLLINQKKTVQPYYLIDADRRSIGAELYAMRNIRRRLSVRIPESNDLVLKTIYFDVFDIHPNPAISASLERFQNKFIGHIGIGRQYDWLARFCDEKAIQDMELGVTGEGAPWKSLEPMMSFSGKGSDRVYWLDAQHQGADEYAVFRYFRFPLWELNKRDMGEISTKESLDDIMALTWFCHNPRPGYTPCGVCVPCRYAMQAGMGWRIPWTGKLRYYTNIKGLVVRNTRLSNSLRTIRRKLA